MTSATMEQATKTITIAGAGFVGGALATVLPQARIYDPFKGQGTVEDLNSADIVFVCVPTPYDDTLGGFDLSAVEDVLGKLEGEKIVVIKSTVVPGTTEALQERFPQHAFLFNPEFLVEKQAVRDMAHPDRQIVGYTEQSKEYADEILALLPRAPFEATMGATEAEMVKYFGNTFLSVKVVFANQMYDICEKLGIDYERVKDAASADPRIGATHMDIFFDGYRGYAGKCFPKDMRALLQKAEREGVDLELLATAEKLNNMLRARGQQ